METREKKSDDEIGKIAEIVARFVGRKREMFESCRREVEGEGGERRKGGESRRSEHFNLTSST